MEEYVKVLENQELIVIDRINHLRDQRKYYLDLAKEHGYMTKIVIMNRPYGECLDRVMGRSDHPTLPANLEQAKAALQMYFKNYEYVSTDETDEIENISPDGYDPYMIDLSYKFDIGRRFIVIGDVHGCYDELMELLSKAKWDMASDVIVFTGDLIDRGPKVKEVLEFKMRTRNCYSIISNHENKLYRHILGNKVNSVSLKTTLAQCDEEVLDAFFQEMQRMSYIIKFDKYHVLHAGINPRYSIERQTREFLMYARKFNPSNGSFQDEGSPFWYEYPIKEDIKILFGHEVHPGSAVVSEYACALDAGCVFGNALRALVLQKDAQPELIEVPSSQPKKTHKELVGKGPSHPLDPYNALVAQGMLGRAERGDLVLYNYTDKCAYEKFWNKYTLESRGLIFNKITGEVVARPFSKFFNIGETEGTQLQNLPKEAYEVFDKMDGSFGILYQEGDRYRIATRGSFESIQAKQATEILQEKYEANIVAHVHPYLTLLFEIVYPENRMSPGARLVIDYGTTKDLFLLGAIDRTTGIELDRPKVEEIAKKIGCPIAKKYYYTIEQMIQIQKTLPASQEGFVVRFQSGFRVKVKGDEYLKMSKILNSITPLNLWDLMDEDFNVPSVYLMTIPEEYRGEALDIIYKLKESRDVIMSQIETDIAILSEAIGGLNDFKKIGLWIKANSNLLTHPRLVFPYVRGIKEAISSYVKKSIRPTNNVL